MQSWRCTLARYTKKPQHVFLVKHATNALKKCNIRKAILLPFSLTVFAMCGSNIICRERMPQMWVLLLIGILWGLSYVAPCVYNIFSILPSSLKLWMDTLQMCIRVSTLNKKDPGLRDLPLLHVLLTLYLFQHKCCNYRVMSIWL